MAEAALVKAQAERNQAAEALRRAEKLAVVGEVAGRVAHELLNPITAVLSRTQAEMDYLNVGLRASRAMKEIIADWKDNLKAGKLSEYLHQRSPGKADTAYAEEDLVVLSQALQKNSEGLNRSESFLCFLEHQIGRVVKIIEGLRSMASSRKEKEELHVNGCLREVVDLFQDGLRKRNIELVQELTPGLPRIYADYTELFQVFSNLLRNAMEAVEKKGAGGGEITLKSEVAGEEIWVRVIDSGVGIPEGERGPLFEHDLSARSRRGGAGLGLPISRRLVREMSGDLILESSISGGGSVFLVKLPLTKAPRTAEIDTEKVGQV